MTRLAPTLTLLALATACGSEPTEAEVADLQAQAAAAEAVVEMEEAMISIPASELEMLEQEVAFLREETQRMTQELAEADDAPEPRLVARSVSARGSLVRAEQELARLKAELAETRTALAKSEARNGELEADLTETREVLVQTTERLTRTEKDLEDTREDLDGALRVAANAGWSDLVSQSQVALCPKGGRKKMERCRADARASIAHLEPAARACLRAGYAAPNLQGRSSGESMPRQAVWIGESDRDWYVVLCDPTLPEAQALLADLDERGRPSGSADLPELEDELDLEPKASTARSRVTRVSREEPVRSAPVRSEPAPAPLPEPEDLLADGDGDGLDLADLEALGLEDLDGDSDDDKKKSRAERRREKQEQEALEEASRRSLRLDRAGKDLVDE